MKTFTCYTYGYATGDPGRAAIGVVITDAAGTVMNSCSEVIGNSTENYAAYQAVFRGLEILQSLVQPDNRVTLVLDSEYVTQQLNAELPIQEPALVPLFIAVHNLRVVYFPKLVITNIGSDGNAARALATAALDGM